MESTSKDENCLAQLLTEPPKKRGRPRKRREYYVGERNLNLRELVPFMRVGCQISMWCEDVWPTSLSKTIFSFHFLQGCSAYIKFPCVMEMSRTRVHPLIESALSKVNLKPQDVTHRPNFVPGFFNIVSPVEATWTVSVFDAEVKDGALVFQDLN